ncbi:MAG: hypothetical protein EOP34_04890 [Rickettsiales bacterium]|nr:MAG: hypothetical protein EOP34_04890 [Rickettsiales bacterium]
MAKFFLKSKNKTFRVRRKKIHWFNTQAELSVNKITVNKLLLNSIKTKKIYKTKILLHMSNIFDNYLVKLIKQKELLSLAESTLTKNNNLLLLYTVYTNYVKNTILKSSSTPEYVDKLTTLGIQGVVFSSPKKQMYAVIINKLPTLIFSAGLMRLAMNLEAKCSKKSKIVIVNSLKFI